MTRVAVVSLMLASVLVGACRASPSAAPTVTLNAGRFTPLGGVQKSDHPTPSEWADLQAAENGTLGQPALVEFYADY